MARPVQTETAVSDDHRCQFLVPPYVGLREARRSSAFRRMLDDRFRPVAEVKPPRQPHLVDETLSPDPLDAPPIGERLVSEIAGPVGDLVGQTLERLSGHQLPDEGGTSLTQRAARAWKTPIEAMTCEQLRLLLSQDLGTPWIAPLACLVVTSRPNATVTYYPGDLAQEILRAFPMVYASDPKGARAVLASDFRWIEKLRATDEEFGSHSAVQADELLKAARALIS